MKKCNTIIDADRAILINALMGSVIFAILIVMIVTDMIVTGMTVISMTVTGMGATDIFVLIETAESGVVFAGTPVMAADAAVR